MTYCHQYCQVDLTQVINVPSAPVSTESDGQPAEKEKSHELEIELRDVETLKAEAENARAGRPSKYADMVRVFVDNVRLLARLDNK
jgi:mRNA capping enzyme, beta chain